MTECDPDVFKNGRVIAILGDVSSELMETWTQLVAKESGQKVDWFWMGGRAVVKAVGDLSKVDEAAYWTCIMDGKVRCLNPNKPGRLKEFGGAQSWHNYYPGGKNHWSHEYNSNGTRKK